MAFALAAAVVAEPPSSGYNYNRGGGAGFAAGGGFGGSGFGGGFGGGAGGGFGGGAGGGYQTVSDGFQTSEGLNVDPKLLEQVRQILLSEESKASSSVGGGFGGGFGGGAPSSQYGVPSQQYGVPSGGSYASRVVGVDLEGVRQAIQVAHFAQTSHQAGGGFGGYAPSGSYGAPRAPSGSYGAPF